MTHERFDMLAVAEHFEAERQKQSPICPVCNTRYDDEGRFGHTIQILTGPDTCDTYPCPGCRPDDYPPAARSYGDSDVSIERMLVRAARDVAAGRRLTRAEHAAASQRTDHGGARA